MNKVCLTALLLLCCGCAGKAKSDPLVGNYIGWTFVNGQAQASDGSQGILLKLTLKPDGTYTQELRSSVMMKLSSNAKGTYSHSGDEVKLHGTVTSDMDDGYKKSKDTRPHNVNLKLKDGMLRMNVESGESIYFRKANTGRPHLSSQPQLKKSETNAVELIKKVEKTYASLKSLRVTGTFKSKSVSSMAEKATFKVLFKGPSKFLFEALIPDGEKEGDFTEITWNGGPKCWWYTKEFGETEERDLGNAISIVGVKFGPEAKLLASLLLPKEFLRNSLSEDSTKITLLKSEKIGKKTYAVIQLRGKGADVTKLWVDESSGLILRMFESIRGVTVDFSPEPNVEHLTTAKPRDQRERILIWQTVKALGS